MSLLKCNNLFYVNDDKEILKAVSLDIKEGQCISVIGQSGSGKSTLLKLFANLISPTSGAIYFDKKSYCEYDPVLLRRSIGYCPQLPYLFGSTVYDNLIFPFEIRKEKFNKSKIIDLLEKLKLDESFLDRKVDSLSGGEKQRIALVRSVIFPPKILLLDEVTSALDKENKEIVENFIKDLNSQGITIMAITHDEKESVSIYSRRLTISNGFLVKDEEIK